MNLNKSGFVIILLIVLILCISNVSAEIEDTNITSSNENSSLQINECQEDIEINDYENLNKSEDIIQSSIDEYLENSEDIIEVNNWEELQYYCSLTDKDYTLKLKDNTNFYPSSLNDSSCQIKIKNNVKIIGGNNSYIGDPKSYSLTTTGFPTYVPIIVEDEYIKVSLTLENVTFKWIRMVPGFSMEDGIFIKIGGKKNSVFKNCLFQDITTLFGHSCIVHLMKGTMTFDNCSFINCTNSYGCLSVYGSSPHMIVQNCYFENNYSPHEPGCINNCGKLTVYNTTFFKNRSKYWAGAIHTHSGASSTIHDSYFIDNVAGWNGGALYAYGNLKIYNSVFIGNNCTTDNGGGAIGACEYGSQPHIYVEGCLFKDNANNCWYADDMSDGPGRGGAISFMDRGSLEVRDTTFISNVAAKGSAICAWAIQGYGSPDVIIVNNSFINHTRMDDVLNVYTWSNTIRNVSNNYYYGNSIVFSNLTLTKLSEGREQAAFQITAKLTNPGSYDQDILNKTLYDVYINNNYVKTVNSTIFTIDFEDLDICNVYVIPTISNRKSNSVTAISTREYIFVSKNKGNDTNSGMSRDNPVHTIQKALELANNCQNIILLDGDYSENLQISYEVTIKGEGNATLTNNTSFTINTNNFTLKNLKINNLNINTFIKQYGGRAIISNCIFDGNIATNLIDADNIDISKSIFINNDAIIVYNNNFTKIADSILLNNSDIIQGNRNYNLDYNWWGNTLENPDKIINLNINNWLILNVTSNVNSLENNHDGDVYSCFYLNNQKYLNLPSIDFDVDAVNGAADKDVAAINTKITYTLTGFADGYLTLSYNNIQSRVNFQFLKSDPGISIASDDVMYGDDLVIHVVAPGDATGNVTVFVGNLNRTMEITNPKTTFTFNELKAGNYQIKAIYSGDKKYFTQNKTSSVNVNKYESTTLIDLSAIEVNKDLIIFISTNDDASGNVTFKINNYIQTLTLTDAKTNYTLPAISRGDYIITAVYNGDEKYLASQDSVKIEVDNLNATMKITAEDITYGDVAIINIELPDDAMGNVSVTIDGVSNTSGVLNGRAQVFLSNIDAGSKNIDVFYTGDDTYFNLTKYSTFTINKANLTFNISSQDIMIGKVAVIKITVPKRTSGTFTINGVTLGIPLSGEVEYLIRDLNVGNYTVTAVYDGNNYNTVSNTTSFSVNEYPTPQWANKGENTENTGKSPYPSNTNGEILFTLHVNETVNGITIDSEGNIYITTNVGIYSYTDDGVFRWSYESNMVLGNFSESVIGRETIITPKSGDKLYFINQTSGEPYDSNLWQGSSLFAPVIDDDATVYTVSEYQVDSSSYKLVKISYKLWENGGDPTLMDLGNNTPVVSPVICDDIIVVLLENGLRVMDKNTLQTKFIKSTKYQLVRPVIGEGSIIYIASSDSIIAYNSNGAQLWKTKITGGRVSQLLLDCDIGLYAVNGKGNLYRYDLVNGRQSLISNLCITSGVLIDQNNNLFFGSDNFFYGIDSDGTVLWKSDLGSKITGAPVMGENGIIYVSTSDNNVHALTLAELKDPIFNITVEENVLTVNYDSECVHGISFTLNGKSYSVDSISISDLPAGTYDVNVSYVGDLRFAKTSKIFNFTIKADSFITVENDSLDDFSIALPDGAGGNVTFIVDDSFYAIRQLINSRLNISFDFIAGNHQILMIYSGDDKYNGCNRTFGIYVPYRDADLDVAIPSVFEDEDVIITIKINNETTGNVSFTLNGVDYSFETSNGTIVKVISNLSVGTYSVNVTYPGDSRFNEASKIVTFHVRSNAVPLLDPELEVAIANIVLGEKAVITIKINNQTTGNVSFTLNNVNYSFETGNGIIIKEVPDLSVGTYKVNVTYPGDLRFKESSKTVSFNVKAVTSISVTVSGSLATINLANDATGTVTVKVNDKAYTKDLVNGKASFSLPDGSYDAIITYSGDSKYAGFVKTVKFTVKKPVTVTKKASKIVAKKKTFKAKTKTKKYTVTLKSGKTPIRKVKLTIKIKNKTFKATTNNKGKATFKIKKLTRKGKYTANIKFAGNKNYKASSKKVKIVIK